MKKKKDYLTEYNKSCQEAGLTYAQMQQQETMRRMRRIHIPEGYKINNLIDSPENVKHFQKE